MLKTRSSYFSMLSLESTLISYATRHLPSLPGDYTWKFDPSAVQTRFGLTVAGATWYAKTRALKRELSQIWASKPTEQFALADYAVRIWGGVKRNAPATILSYVQTVAQGQVPKSHKGIASWSKIAAFSDPGKHAIFDARVSFSLNAIQFLLGDGQRWWFPHLPGRNTLLEATWPFLQAHSMQQGWNTVKSTLVYSTYIDQLKLACSALGNGVDIDDIEMLLFAKAEELAKAVRGDDTPLRWKHNVRT